MSASERPVLHNGHLGRASGIPALSITCFITVVYAEWHIYGYIFAVSKLVNRFIGSKVRVGSPTFTFLPDEPQ